MAVDPANAREAAEIASEVGAAVLSGDLRYPSENAHKGLGYGTIPTAANVTQGRWLTPTVYTVLLQGLLDSP